MSFEHQKGAKATFFPTKSLNFEIFLFSEAVNCLSKAIDIYTDMGRFTIAAKHHQTIAEVYESDIADLERAMQHYEKSADYFRVWKQ